MLTIEYNIDPPEEDGVTIVSIWSEECEHWHPLCAAANYKVARAIVNAFRITEQVSENNETTEESQTDDNCNKVGEAI